MSILEIFYTACVIATQTAAPTIPCFQSIKRYVQYLDSHTHKTIFQPSNTYDFPNVIIITCIGNQVEYYSTAKCGNWDSHTIRTGEY